MLISCFSLFFPFSTEKNNYSFIETSALDNTNVGEAFNNLLVGESTLLTHSHTMTPFDAPGKKAF